MANNTINDVTPLVNSNQNALNELMSQIREVNNMIQQFGSQVGNSAGIVSNSFSQIASNAISATQAMQQMAGKMGEYGNSVKNSQSSVVSFTTSTMSTIVLMKNFYGVVKSVATTILAKNAAMGASTIAVRIYHSCMTGLTVQLTAATIAATALSAALTMGLSIAITGIIAGIGFLISREDEAEKSTESLTEQQKEYNDILSKTKGEMILVTAELKNFIGNKAEEAAKVKELNNKYGETFGYYRSVEAWYNALISKSKDYCDAMVLEAKIREMVNKVAGSEMKYEELQKTYQLVNPKPTPLGPYEITTESQTTDTSVTNIDFQNAVLVSAQNEIKKNRDQLDSYVQQLNDKKKLLKEGSGSAPQPIKPNTSNENNTNDPVKEFNEIKNYEELDYALSIHQKNLKSADAEERAILTAKIISLQNLRKEWENLSLPELPAPNMEQIKTYEDIENALNHYSKKQKTAGEAERSDIAERIKELQNLRKAWEEASNPKQAPAPIEQLNTQKDLNEALSFYQELQQTQTGKDFLNTQVNIDGIQKKQGSLQSLAALPGIQKEAAELELFKDDKKKLQMELEVIGIDELKGKLENINSILGNQKSGLNEEEIEKLGELKNQYEGYFETLSNSRNITEDMANGFGAMGNAMGNLSGMVGEGAGQWLEWGANVLNSVGVAITQMAALLPAKNADAVANTKVAGTGAAAAVSSIPIIGPILAVAAIASVIAAIASIPKFANGGIAYGPTLGLFGEYSGASSNPEVVAPLDKLRTLIQPAGGGTGGRVEFKIQGRELVGILSKMNHINSRVHG